MKAAANSSILRILVVAVSGLVLLVGCSANQGSAVTSAPSRAWTLPAAKAIAQSTETRIAAAIPAEYVAAIEQLPSSPLLSCDIPGQDGFVWPGRTTVTLQTSPDIAALFKHIRDAWRRESGYLAKSNSFEGDGYDVEISGPDDASYFLAFRPKHNQITISSFSPCFELPGGDNGGYY